MASAGEIESRGERVLFRVLGAAAAGFAVESEEAAADRDENPGAGEDFLENCVPVELPPWAGAAVARTLCGERTAG